MLRFFLPGQNVPNWLEKQTPRKGFENDCTYADIIFGSPTIVFAYKNNYHAVSVGFGLLVVVHGGKHIDIYGRSITGEQGCVYWYTNPIQFMLHMIRK